MNFNKDTILNELREEFDDEDIVFYLNDEIMKIILNDERCSNYEELAKLVCILFEFYDDEERMKDSLITDTELRNYTMKLFNDFKQKYKIIYEESDDEDIEMIYEKMHCYIFTDDGSAKISVYDYIIMYGTDDDLRALQSLLLTILIVFDKIIHKIRYGWIEEFDKMKKGFMEGGSINDLSDGLGSIEHNVMNGFNQEVNEKIRDILDNINGSD